MSIQAGCPGLTDMHPSILSLLTIALFAMGCVTARPSGDAPEGAALSGTVTYLPRIALPPTAVASVRLLAVSRADATAETLAEQTIATQGRSVPLPFSLRYDADEIDARHRYVVRADIRDAAGALLWTTDTAVPVLTNGAPTSDVEVRLIQVTDETVSATVGALIGPLWRVHHVSAPGLAEVPFDDPGGVMLPLDGPALYTLRFEPDGRYSGQMDCNRTGGSFQADDDGSLEIQPGPTTLAACPEGSAADGVLRVLAGAERYVVAGDRLELRGPAGTLVLVRDGASGEANTGALPGPGWTLTEVRSASCDAEPPQGDGRFTIVFMGDGRFTGQADCNRYGGTFEANSNGELVLTNPSTTIAACAPPSSSRAFFGTLNQVVGFGTANGRLMLRGGDGSALVFEREAGVMLPQETGQTQVFVCDADDVQFTTRTGPGELAVWLPPRFGRPYLVLGQVRAASGAKYQDGPVTVWTKGADDALLEVDGETFTDCVNDPQRAVWEDAKLSGWDFRAVGQEPGWELRMRRDLETAVGQRARFVYGYGQQEATLVPTDQQTEGRQTVFSGASTDGRPFTLTLDGRPCTDTMSGEAYETTVAVTFDGETFRGCGQALH